MILLNTIGLFITFLWIFIHTAAMIGGCWYLFERLYKEEKKKE